MRVEGLGGFQYWRSRGSVEETVSGMTTEGATFPGWMTWFACRGWIGVGTKLQTRREAMLEDLLEIIRPVDPRLFNKVPMRGLEVGYSQRRGAADD